MNLEAWLVENNPQSWEDWDHECHSRGVVRREISNGTIIYVEQCELCGRQIKARKKQEVASSCIGSWDDTLQKKWRAAQRDEYERRMARLQKDRDEQDAIWRRQYETHLNSTRWHDLRKRVLKRANGVCEGCGIYYPSDVHHISYKNLGNEFLFELLAVCRGCHERIHGRSFAEEASI